MSKAEGPKPYDRMRLKLIRLGLHGPSRILLHRGITPPPLAGQSDPEAKQQEKEKSE